MANVGTLAVNLVARTETFSKKMKGAGKDIGGLRGRLASLKPSATAVASSLAAVTVAATAAVSAFAVKSVNTFREFGDQLDKMSARTGVSVESLSELKFAAEQAGTDVETLEKGLFGLSRAVFDAGRGSAEAVDAFKKLGISYAEIAEQSPEEQFKVVANALAQVANEGERGALAQKLLGRAGRQLLPMVGTLEKIRNEARELGLVLSTEDAKAAADLTDSMNKLKSSIRGVSLSIGSAIAGPLKEWVDWFTDATLAVREFRKEYSVLAGILGGGIKSVGGAIRDTALQQVGVGGVTRGVVSGARALTGGGDKTQKDQLDKQSSMDSTLKAIEANTTSSFADQIIVNEVVIRY